jgi:hypothetical protein
MFTNATFRLVAPSLILFFSVRLPATDWLTLPANYSHGQQGERLAQHQTAAPSIAPAVSDFTKSGYRNTRSTLQYDQGADNYHTVEQWGPPVRPYEEWRFPFRPFSSPYPNWGPPPFAGSGIGVGIGVFPGYGHGAGFGGFGGTNYPGFGGAPGGYSGQPWFDGNYPNSPQRPYQNDRQFFAKPFNY